MFRQCYAIDYLTNETAHSRIESRSICALKKKLIGILILPLFADRYFYSLSQPPLQSSVLSSGGRGKGLGGDWGGETHEQRSWCPLKIAKRWRLLFTPVTSHNCNHSASRKVKVARKPVRLHIPKPCKKQKGSITVHGILFSPICRRSIMQCLDHTIARHFRYTEFERQSYFECEWKIKVNKKKTSHIC